MLAPLGRKPGQQDVWHAGAGKPTTAARAGHRHSFNFVRTVGPVEELREAPGVERLRLEEAFARPCSDHEPRAPAPRSDHLINEREWCDWSAVAGESPYADDEHLAYGAAAAGQATFEDLRVGSYPEHAAEALLDVDSGDFAASAAGQDAPGAAQVLDEASKAALLASVARMRARQVLNTAESSDDAQAGKRAPRGRAGSVDRGPGGVDSGGRGHFRQRLQRRAQAEAARKAAQRRAAAAAARPALPARPAAPAPAAARREWASPAVRGSSMRPCYPPTPARALGAALPPRSAGDSTPAATHPTQLLAPGGSLVGSGHDRDAPDAAADASQAATALPAPRALERGDVDSDSSADEGPAEPTSRADVTERAPLVVHDNYQPAQQRTSLQGRHVTATQRGAAAATRTSLRRQRRRSLPPPRGEGAAAAKAPPPQGPGSYKTAAYVSVGADHDAGAPVTPEEVAAAWRVVMRWRALVGEMVESVPAAQFAARRQGKLTQKAFMDIVATTSLAAVPTAEAERAAAALGLTMSEVTSLDRHKRWAVQTLTRKHSSIIGQVAVAAANGPRRGGGSTAERRGDAAQFARASFPAAIWRFDAERYPSFGVWAYTFLLHEVKRELRGAADELHVSEYERQKRRKVVGALGELFGSAATRDVRRAAEDAAVVEAVAARAGYKAPIVRACLRNIRSGVSFRAVEARDGVDSVSLAEFEDAEAARAERERAAALPAVLAQLVVLLPREQAQLIAMRYGLLGYEAHSAAAMAAARGGQSVEYVRLLLGKAQNALAALLARNREALIERTDDAALLALLRRAPGAA